MATIAIADDQSRQSLSAYGIARSTVEGAPLSAEDLKKIDACSEVDSDLVEWNYGEYEGRRTVEILAKRPAGNCSAAAA